MLLVICSVKHLLNQRTKYEVLNSINALIDTLAMQVLHKHIYSKPNIILSYAVCMHAIKLCIEHTL